MKAMERKGCTANNCIIRDKKRREQVRKRVRDAAKPAAAAAQAGLLISCYVAACLKALLIQFSCAEQAGSGVRNESPLSLTTPPPSFVRVGCSCHPYHTLSTVLTPRPSFSTSDSCDATFWNTINKRIFLCLNLTLTLPLALFPHSCSF